MSGREGEGDTGSGFRAVSTEPDVGLELTNCEIMTWAEVSRSTNWPTQSPQEKLFVTAKDIAKLYSLGDISLPTTVIDLKQL